MVLMGQSTITFTVNANQPLIEISPYIYGTNQPDWAGRSHYLTLGRLGGNRITAYNWENNASNAGSDWYHQNDDYLGGGNTPGEVIRKTVSAALQKGAGVVVTVPMAGYVAADKNGGGDVNQTPNFLSVRFRQSKPRKTIGYTSPPNLNDAYVYQDEMVWWLERTFARRAAPIFYALDNEADLWSSTHARIRPTPITYAEIVALSEDYADNIKRIQPKALIFGPVNYGWNGYITLQGAPDANGRDFLNFYLQSMQQAAQRKGKRLLDVLDLHYYSEARGGGFRITETGNAQTADARVQATRSLWDPTYRESSWINDNLGGPIRLLPRMKEKIATYYPGTRLAFTEYNFGGQNDPSGAVAQADTLGLFGAYGVFAACWWDLGGARGYIDAAFEAFRNFDGRGAAFGNVALATTNNTISQSAFYASADRRRPGRYVMVAINRATTAKIARIAFTGITGRTARAFRISGSPALTAIGNVNLANSFSMPARSVTVFEMLPGL